MAHFSIFTRILSSLHLVSSTGFCAVSRSWELSNKYNTDNALLFKSSVIVPGVSEIEFASIVCRKWFDI